MISTNEFKSGAAILVDGALWVTPEIARAKANAAAAFRASTLDLEERFNQGR